MVKVFDFEQNTLEWFEAKWGKIGGTLSKGLLVKSDTLLIDILSQHLEEFEPTDSYENQAMIEGRENEPFAIQWLEQRLGIKFEKPAICISTENDLLCYSPDGLSECDRFGAEVKCPQRKAHTKILFENETPLEYISQIVHAFTVNPKMEKFWFLSFRPQSPKHFLKEYNPDTLINMGTKAKPVMKTIREWTQVSKDEATLLKLELNQSLASFENDF